MYLSVKPIAKTGNQDNIREVGIPSFVKWWQYADVDWFADAWIFFDTGFESIVSGGETGIGGHLMVVQSKPLVIVPYQAILDVEDVWFYVIIGSNLYRKYVVVMFEFYIIGKRNIFIEDVIRVRCIYFNVIYIQIIKPDFRWFYRSL